MSRLEKDLGGIVAEETETRKNLNALRKQPPSRKIVEAVKALETKLEELAQIKKRLKEASERQTAKERVAELETQNDELGKQIQKTRQGIDQFRSEVEKNPLTHEIAGKFGLRVFNKAEGMFNKSDNLSARIRDNLEQIRRLDLQIDR